MMTETFSNLGLWFSRVPLILGKQFETNLQLAWFLVRIPNLYRAPQKETTIFTP